MKTILNIKTPSNIYLWWNLGSAIRLIILIQILTGLILSINYIVKPNPFDRSINIYLNLNYGWVVRLIHRNLTSVIFIIIFIHIARGLIFKSFFLTKIWITGIIIIIIVIIESFIGYSLIWNQISYWAIIVITNFISAIPKIGKTLIKIVWGNFNINIILVNRFLTLHFLIPLLISLIIIIHMLILHLSKSNNPIGLKNNIDLIKLNPNFIIKDIIVLTLLIIITVNIILIRPFLFRNRDNFLIINYFKTPNHIEPEWYFIFFYSILRSINNKLRGLIILAISILILILTPLFNLRKTQNFNPIYKTLSVILISIILLIGTLRKSPVEFPYKEINITIIYLYFLTFVSISLINKIINNKV